MLPIASKPSKPPASENVCPEPCCVLRRKLDRVSVGSNQTCNQLASASSSVELGEGSEMHTDSDDDGDEYMSEDEIKSCVGFKKEMEEYNKKMEERIEQQSKAMDEEHRREMERLTASFREDEDGPSHAEILKEMKANRKKLVNLCFKLIMQSRAENDF